MSLLRSHGVEVVNVSRLFKTVPIGGGRQPPYVNAAVVVTSEHSPRELLRICKQIEREAGRTLGRRWGPRVLDLDIIDYAGRCVPGRQVPAPTALQYAGLILPHPRAHARSFVLIPVAEIAPAWRHPRLGATAEQLLRRRPLSERRAIIPMRPWPLAPTAG